MTNHKDFEGRNLDEAIKEACDYYGVEREKLEIDILNDAKTGIFGLVGVKKARIRATRAQALGTALFEEEEVVVSPAPRGKSTAKPAKREKASLAPAEEPQLGDSQLDFAAQIDGTNDKGAKHRRPGRAAPLGNIAGDIADNIGNTVIPGSDIDDSDEMLDIDDNIGNTLHPNGNSTRRTGGRAEPQGRQGARTANSRFTGEQQPERNASARNADDRGNNRRSRPGNRQEGEGARPSGERDARSRQPDDRKNGRPANDCSPRQPDERGNGRQPIASTPDSRQKTRNNPALRGNNERSEGGLSEENLREDLPEISLEHCDKEKVVATVKEVVSRLAEPIVGAVPCTVVVGNDRVRATVECGEDSGLLVGREGQTLAAVQYLAGRIVGRLLGGSFRLQVDAGNYRERQDDRLKELALALAEKAKTTKRAQSTRPLSAYQRRLIHLALEEDAEVQTSSKGEGLQRRVIIQLRRQRGNGGAPNTLSADDAAHAQDILTEE